MSCCSSLPGQRHDVVWLIFTEAGAQSLIHISTKWLFNVIQLFIHLHTDHENIIRYSKSSSCLLMSLLWQLSSLNPKRFPHTDCQGAGPIEKHRVPMSPEPAKRSKKAAMALNSARWPCSCDWGRNGGRGWAITIVYPLVNIQKTMENHHF